MIGLYYRDLLFKVVYMIGGFQCDVVCFVCVCIYIYKYTHICVCVCVCIYVYLCMYKYICALNCV